MRLHDIESVNNSTNYVLGMVVSTLQMLTHLILPDNIIDSYCCYSCFTVEETEAPRV